MAIKIPQVREKGLPTTTGVKTPNANAFGAGAGDALGGLANTLGDIGLELQNKENNAKARETDTYFTEKLGNLQLAYQQQDGEAAYKGNPDYERAVLDIRKEAEGRLENDAQREMVRALFDNKQNSAVYAGKSHSIKALQKWQESTIQGQNETNMQSAVAGFGTPAGDQAVANLMAGIEDMGFEKNWSDEQIAAEQVKARSGVASAFIQGKIQSDPALAWRTFQDAKASGDLAPLEAAKIENRVTAAWDDYTVYEAARVLMAQAPGDLPAQVAEARQIQDPEKQQKLLGYLKENAKLEAMMEAQAQEDVAIRAFDNVVKAGPNAKLHQLPSAAEVGVDMRKKLELQVDKQQTRTEQFKTDRTYEQQEILKYEADPEAYNKTYKRSDHVDKMTRTDLDAFEKRIKQAPDDNKYSAKDVKKTSFALLGIAGTKLKGSKLEKQIAVGRDVDARINSLKEEKGREPTRDEMIRIEKNVVYDYKTSHALPSIELDGTGMFSDDVVTPLQIRERQQDPVTAIKDTKGTPYSIQDVEFAIWSITRDRNDPDLTDTDIREFLRQFEKP